LGLPSSPAGQSGLSGIQTVLTGGAGPNPGWGQPLTSPSGQPGGNSGQPVLTAPGMPSSSLPNYNFTGNPGQPVMAPAGSSPNANSGAPAGNQMNWQQLINWLMGHLGSSAGGMFGAGGSLGGQQNGGLSSLSSLFPSNSSSGIYSR
jgi:hypothetical protein